MQLVSTHFRYLQAILLLNQQAARTIRENANWQPEVLYQLIQLSRCWESYVAVDPDWDQLPPDLLAKLKKRLERNRRQRQLIQDARDEIRQHLNHSTFPLIWLKGDVLGGLYWRQPDHRHQFDMDVLVAEDDLKSALECMSQIGFQRKKKPYWLVKKSLFRGHAIALFRGGVELDLHWCVRNRPVYQFNNRRMWNRARRAELPNGTVLTLSISDLLAAQLISVFHDLGRGGCSLKGLLDIWLMLESEQESIDWCRFRDERLEEHAWGPCANVLSLVLQLFDSTRVTQQLRFWLDHDHQLIAPGTHQPFWLSSLPRRSPEAHQWMVQILPIASFSDGLWLFSRSFPDPGRTLSIFRSLSAQMTSRAQSTSTVFRLGSSTKKKAG